MNQFIDAKCSDIFHTKPINLSSDSFGLLELSIMTFQIRQETADVVKNQSLTQW